MKKIKNTFYSLYQYLAKQTFAANHQITLFAIVMMINFPLFGVLWKFENFQLNEEFYLRLIATSICCILASHQFWSPSFKKYLPIIWYIALLFCLPFFFTYLTLLNRGSAHWLMNCVTAIFLLFLVTPRLDAVIILFLGLGLGITGYSYISGEINNSEIAVSLYSLSITLLAVIILASIFSKNR